jgi:hypothetical protein
LRHPGRARRQSGAPRSRVLITGQSGLTPRRPSPQGVVSR